MVSIFGRTKERAPAKRELVELDWEHPAASAELMVKVIGLEKFTDVDAVLDAMRTKKNIVIMKVRSSLFADKAELTRAIRRVQKTAYAIGGDIIGLAEDLLIVTPPSVAIERPKETSS